MKTWQNARIIGQTMKKDSRKIKMVCMPLVLLVPLFVMMSLSYVGCLVSLMLVQEKK